MPKTLTEKLNAIKAAGKGIFVPYIMAGDHEKGLDGLGETIHFFRRIWVSLPLKWAFPFQTLLQMDLLLKKLVCAV